MVTRPELSLELLLDPSAKRHAFSPRWKHQEPEASGAFLESESNSEKNTLGPEGERPSHGDIFELQFLCAWGLGPGVNTTSRLSS